MISDVGDSHEKIASTSGGCLNPPAEIYPASQCIVVSVAFRDSASASSHLGRLTKYDTVFHTLFASDGRALAQTNAELIIDLMSGDTLDVHFAQFPERYRVRYDLSGFAKTAMNTMHQCRTSGFTEGDVLEYWSDKTHIAELVND